VRVSLDAFGDVIEFAYPDPDDPRLVRVHKKGFLEEVRRLPDSEVLEWSKLYPAWFDRKLRYCPVYEFEDGTVAVRVPKLRALRSDYYAWIRGLDLPKLYYRLVTLTLYREVGLVRAWSKINRWVSACLNRVRVKLKREFGVGIFYLWVVEVHRDGFPACPYSLWVG